MALTGPQGRTASYLIGLSGINRYSMLLYFALLTVYVRPVYFKVPPVYLKVPYEDRTKLFSDSTDKILFDAIPPTTLTWYSAIVMSQLGKYSYARPSLLACELTYPVLII